MYTENIKALAPPQVKFMVLFVGPSRWVRVQFSNGWRTSYMVAESTCFIRPSFGDEAMTAEDCDHPVNQNLGPLLIC